MTDGERTRTPRPAAVAQLALAVVSVGLVVWLAVRGLWPAAAIWAVPTLGWLTRLVLVLRERRTPLNRRRLAVVFLVQFAGWVAVSGYLLTLGWWGAAIGIAFLACMSGAMVLFLRRSEE
jgi:O-antigen/teichoic acid export membrane protein